MKKIFFVAIFFLGFTMQSVHAQSWFIDIKGGNSLSVFPDLTASQYIDEDINHSNSSYNSWNNVVETDRKAPYKLGRGHSYSSTIGYMIKPHFGIAMNSIYFRGNIFGIDTFFTSYESWEDPDGYSRDHYEMMNDTLSFRYSSFAVSPLLVFGLSSGWKWNLIAMLGPLCNLYNRMNENEVLTYNNSYNSISINSSHYSFHAKPSLGVECIVQLHYALSKTIDVFAETSYKGVGFSPATKLKIFESGIIDTVATYVDELTLHDGVPDKLTDALKFHLNASRISFLVGLNFSFGKSKHTTGMYRDGN